jgi:uncharacterized membrane protein YqjE
MEETSSASGGVMSAGRRLLRTALDLAHTRLELFLVELKEERLRLVDALLLVVVGVVCALMTLVLLTFTLVLIFWEYRVLTLVLLTLLYGASAAAAFWTLRQRLAAWNAFSATLEELKKDRACLDKPN